MLSRPWIRLAPLVLLTCTALALGPLLRPWQFLWALAFAFYAGCKWLTLCDASPRFASIKDGIAYLFAWPGMRPEAWTDRSGASRDAVRRFAAHWVLLRMAIGMAVCVIVARWAPDAMVAGLIGLLGYLLLLHFGVFDLLAAYWRRRGIGVESVMNRPMQSRSPADFWRRWNTAFRDLTEAYVFRPVQSRLGASAGLAAGFLASGLVHELVVSVPAGAGYGLPTVYFLIQGLGVLLSRQRAIRRVLRRNPLIGRAVTALVVLAPITLLFHPPFMTHVFAPFVEAMFG